MADHAYYYEEIEEDGPRNLLLHTPAVENSFSWPEDSVGEADETA
jgi:hypothetical protein